ncbi:ATP-binding protein [Aeromicrobium alkaliterrae]|uniref:Histidine kinase/HSP90-like ATPase domain-containing protein n=1 Tax=Aeromicrobium alkaliterrae TaxID=302168 RepID=A0ABP4VZT3_9ACTN
MSRFWTHVDDDPCTTVHLPFDVTAPRAARQQMVDELTAAGVRETVITDAQLVLTELVANAIEHGRPSRPDTIEIGWCVLADHIRISVCDGGDVRELRPLEFTDSSIRGRGLAMVDILCDRWTVDTAAGTRITAELDFSLGRDLEDA